jgi:hypothetical protein
MATILEIGEEAALKLGIDQPTELFGATNREDKELFLAIKEAAEDLLQGHEWQLLRTINTITGDGSDLDFALPSDFDRLVTDPQMYTSEFETALTFVPEADDWLRYEVQSYDFVINVWTIYQDQIHTKPALGSGVTAKHWYVSNLIFNDISAGSTSATITADDDTFRLDDVALRLGAIYKFRQNKGQPYAEEMADYEKRKALLVYRDGGKPVIRSRPAIGRGVKLSYPEAVSNA